MRIISNLTATPLACVLITILLFLVSLIITYSLLNALLKMHRSKSAVKKIMKEYRFLQKVWMSPYEVHCLHAISFCKFLIYLQRVSYCCFTLYLMTGIFVLLRLPVYTFLAWFSITIWICFDVPLFIADRLVSRPLFGKFKAYSFEKYHNSMDHSSLL